MAKRLELLHLQYVIEHDLLHGSFENEPAATMELDNGVLLHLDQETEQRVIGFTIRNFRARSQQGDVFDVPLGRNGIAEFLKERGG